MPRLILLLAVLAVAPLPAVAGDSGTGAGCCKAAAAFGFDYAYVGPGWTPEKAAKDCATFPGTTYDPGVCSEENLVARCRHNLGKDPRRAIVYLFKKPTSLKQAQMSCPGEFEPVK